jgi:hypothetical protein
MKNYDLSSLCRDAFVLLHGAERIAYKGGDAWAAEDGEEHPLVPRLRAASLQSLIEDPPTSGAVVSEQLAIERSANEGMRHFLGQLQDLCEQAGAPPAAVGGDLLAWLTKRLK